MSGRSGSGRRQTALAPVSESMQRQLDELRRRDIKITVSAQKVVAGLFEEPGSPEYNDDAEKTRNEMSVRTWASMEILKTAKADHREDRADARAFGSVILQHRLDEKSWEEMADRYEKMKDNAGKRGSVIDIAGKVIAENVSK